MQTAQDLYLFSLPISVTVFHVVLQRSVEVFHKEDISQLEPGDLVFYGSGYIDHVALYIGDGRLSMPIQESRFDYDYENPLQVHYVHGIAVTPKLYGFDKLHKECQRWKVDKVIHSIHIPIIEKSRKLKLYTKLSTLSTFLCV